MAGIYKSEAGRQAVEGRYRDALQRWPVPNRQVLENEGHILPRQTTAISEFLKAVVPCPVAG